MNHKIIRRILATLCIIAIAITAIPLFSERVSSSENATQSIPETAVAATDKSKMPPRLKVSGNRLVDTNGNTVQLRGVSTHGLAWYPEYVNKAAFKRLRDNFGANTIRLALYTEEYGGYCAGGDRKALKRTVFKGVRYATELGMYVIIDWHILNDNNPNTHLSDAKKFFRTVAKKYKKYNNVLFEICNEPHGVSWHNDIKPYAKKITKIIRKYDKRAVIIVGTNMWSQDVTDVIGDRLSDKNTVYALHFYAATHGDDLRNKMQTALDAGIPVFVSECSVCDASGNGSIDYSSAKKWLKLMNNYNVSFIAWNLSNKGETSALIRSDCQKTSGWRVSDLSSTGKWFRKHIRALR